MHADRAFALFQFHGIVCLHVSGLFRHVAVHLVPRLRDQLSLCLDLLRPVLQLAPTVPSAQRDRKVNTGIILPHVWKIVFGLAHDLPHPHHMLVELGVHVPLAALHHLVMLLARFVLVPQLVEGCGRHQG